MNRPQTKTTLWLLSAGHFTIDSYNGYLAPLLPLLIAKHQLSVALAASLASILAFSTSFLQPLFGYLADKHHFRQFVWATPLIAGGFLSFIGTAPNYEILAILLLLSGLGTAAFHPLGASMAHAASGERKGAGMSVFVTGGNVGHALGPVIILPVVLTIGLEKSFVMIVPAAVMSCFLYRWTPTPQAVSAHQEMRTFDPLRPRLWALLLLWLLVTLRAVVIAGFSNFMPLLLRGRGAPLLLAGSAITIFQLTGSFGALLGGSLSDKIGRHTALLLSFALPVPLFAAFVFVQSFWGLASLAFAGFLIYLSIPANLLEAQDLFPRNLSTISALMIGLAWGVGGLLLTPLGMLIDRFGVEATLAGLTVAPLAGVALTLALARAKAREQEAPIREVPQTEVAQALP